MQSVFLFLLFIIILYLVCFFETVRRPKPAVINIVKFVKSVELGYFVLCNTAQKEKTYISEPTLLRGVL